MMRVSVLACLLAAVAGLATGATGPLVVKTKDGTVRGTTSGLGVQHSVRAWLGIPFAAPPTGSRRWAPPSPPASWDGTLNTTSYTQYCWQNPTFYAPESDMSEDCLYLNVWAPTEASADPLPVAVFIHGGGWWRWRVDAESTEEEPARDQEGVESLSYKTHCIVDE